MSHNRLLRILQNYRPAGRKNQGKQLNRPNRPTSGQTLCQLDDDGGGDGDDNDDSDDDDDDDDVLKALCCTVISSTFDITQHLRHFVP